MTRNTGSNHTPAIPAVGPRQPLTVHQVTQPRICVILQTEGQESILLFFAERMTGPGLVPAESPATMPAISAASLSGTCQCLLIRPLNFGEGTAADMFLARNIVVGVEMPSEHPWSSSQVLAPSRRAIRQALHLSRAAGLPVTLVSVLPQVSAGWFDSPDKAQREQESWTQEAERVLQSLASELGGPSGEQGSIECVVSVGTPWVELLRITKNSPHTLLVCGTRDAGRLNRALFGSTGNKLLRHACGPVWLVKPQADEEQPLEILAATDLTEVGQDVLQTAVSLARSIPSKLHVLHVVEDILDRHIRRTGISAERLEELKKKSRDQAEHAVHDQLAATDFRTLPFGAQVHIAAGSPDLEISECIERLKINLLVMAARGRGGLSGILVGNTAEQLLPELTCSIIVIKPEDFVSPCTF